jgi:hypothetical protein
VKEITEERDGGMPRAAMGEEHGLPSPLPLRGNLRSDLSLCVVVETSLHEHNRVEIRLDMMLMEGGTQHGLCAVPLLPSLAAFVPPG